MKNFLTKSIITLKIEIFILQQSLKQVLLNIMTNVRISRIFVVLNVQNSIKWRKKGKICCKEKISTFKAIVDL